MSSEVATASNAPQSACGCAASTPRKPLAARLRASGIHLSICATVALVLILAVTKIWYPSPLFDVANGRDIFLLMIACDITLGPLMTLIIFNIRKPRRELVRDLAIIGTVQIAAMAYGLFALLVTRPAYIVYNVGRFNVPLANELVAGTEKEASTQSVGAPWFGPPLVGARLPKEGEERTRLIFSAVGGKGDVYQMPRYFVPYSEVRSEAASRAKSAEALAKELQLEPARVRAAVAGFTQSGANVGFLPLMIRQNMAIAVVRLPDGEFLGIAALPPSELMGGSHAG
jgi:hypothetical protein